jgi:hypothetical protein
MKPIIIFLFVSFALYEEQSREWEGKTVPKLPIADGTIYPYISSAKIYNASFSVAIGGRIN